MTQRSLGHRILEGVRLNLLAQGFTFFVNFAVTPIIVGRLGPDGYALYTLMWTATGYLMVLNMGTGVAVQRYVAQHADAASSSFLGSLLRRTLAFALGMSALGGGALLLGSSWVGQGLLNAGPALADVAPTVFACVALSAPFCFALQFAICILYGAQRFKAYNVFLFLQSSAVATLAAVLLPLGAGPVELAQAFLAAHAALAAAALWSVRDFLCLPARSPAKVGPEFARFSAKSFVSQLLWMLTAQGDRFFIGAYLPLSQMGFYAVSSTMAQKLNTLCGAVASTAFPMLTELHGAGQEARLKRFYLKATELSLFVILPLTILAFVLVPQFMTLWLGPSFSAASTWPFRLLLLANLAYLLTFMPNAAALGKGAPEIFIYAQAAKVLILLACWPALIPRWGILGAAGGLLAAEGLVVPLYLARVHRKFVGGLAFAEFWAEACWRPVSAGLVLAVAAWALHARVDTWLELLAFGAGGSALFLGAGWKLLDADARTLLADWLRAKLK